MKILNQTISVTLALSLILSSGMTAFADNTSKKEEIIYIMTDANGNTQNIYAVNIYDSGDITDYGDYSDIMMLNTNDNININDDMITFSSDSDKVYLQGKIKEMEIPWNFRITYILDGKEISPENLAGKNGSLEIHFTVTENEKIKGFYENYALQASFTLDTKLCDNIKADDATIANAGRKKQLTYTILPNKGIDTVMSTDVHDFEMDSVAINGIKLNLSINVDSSELNDKIIDLQDGIVKIDDGAYNLSNGAEELNSGAKSLNTGAKNLKNGASSVADGTGKLSNGMQQLSDGAISLDGGISELKKGADSIQVGLDTLNGKSSELTDGSAEVLTVLSKIQSSINSISGDTKQLEKLVAASDQIMEGISSLKKAAEALESNVGYKQYKTAMSVNGLDIDNLTASNAQAIETLSSMIVEMQDTLSQVQGVPGFEQQVEQLSSQIEQLSDILKLFQGNNAAISGTEVYFDQVSGYITEMKNSITKIETKYAEFNTAIGTLADNLSSMLINLNTLSEGINTLVDKYKKFDSGLGEYTDAVAQIVAGYSQLTTGVETLSTGSKNLVDGASNLSNGARELNDGAQELFDGTKSLYDGSTELTDGMQKLYDGTVNLSDGTNELNNKTSNMDAQVNEKLESILDNLKGSDEIVSFISDKNTDVELVQFVIKTPAIKILDIDTSQEETEEHLNFWQKFLRLFGLY